MIGLNLTDTQIKDMSDNQYKKILKNKIREHAFRNLLSMKETHSKVVNIQYSELKIQNYLTDPMFSMSDKELLLKLRGRMFFAKANYRNMFVNNLQCDYCSDCDLQTQRHLLENCDGIIAECPAVAENIRVEHDDIYGPVEKQKEVVKLYHKIQETINRINDTTN